MKALLWGLYLPDYPTLTIEVRIGDKYKPDLVAFDPNPALVFQAQAKPLFWGESGVVGEDKLYSILRRFPGTHFAFAKWEMNLSPVQKMVADAAAQVRRSAPIDLLRFTTARASQFISAAGDVRISHGEVDWVRIEPG